MTIPRPAAKKVKVRIYNAMGTFSIANIIIIIIGIIIPFHRGAG